MDHSPASVILEAVRLATESDVSRLGQLVSSYPQVLHLELILRILLSYLPETCEPANYIKTLHQLVSTHEESLYRSSTGSIYDFDSSNEFPEDEARRGVRTLHLIPLTHHLHRDELSLDPLSKFLLSRARRIDLETGSLPTIKELIEPFLDHSEYIRSWGVSTLLPLLRLDYEYYPERENNYTIAEFEKLSGRHGVDKILAEATYSWEKKEPVRFERDLRGIVGPWMYGEPVRKRRKISHQRTRSSSMSTAVQAEKGDHLAASDWQNWEPVSTWLLDLSRKDFSKAVEIYQKWGGPGDVDLGGWEPQRSRDRRKEEDDHQAATSYARVGLAMIYQSTQTSGDAYEWMSRLLDRNLVICEDSLDNLDRTTQLPSVDDCEIEAHFLDALSPASLHEERLLDLNNDLTRPNKSAWYFTYLVLSTARILRGLGHSLVPRQIAALSLWEGLEDQRKELRKLISALQASKGRNEQFWRDTREQLLWLRSWGTESKTNIGAQTTRSVGPLCRIDVVDLDIEMLKLILTTNHYKLAVQIYCSATDPPIPKDFVHSTMVEAAFASYDSASNGNMTRGGVKKAHDILLHFQPHFPESENVNRLLSLISATHSLSFYSLTLQHGVPFQPVNIRVHPDPLSLVAKVLDQNSRSYTKLDDLIEIGRNLVKGGLLKSFEGVADPQNLPEKRQLLLAERRITSMAITASLSGEDFDTAYSYIVNRLSLYETTTESSAQKSNGASSDSVAPEDDIIWRAAYQAGQAPLNMGSSRSDLRRLEQRMELLSQVLLLAPSSAIDEILKTWQTCEEQMNLRASQEAEEESRWDDGSAGKAVGVRTVPGGFTLEDVGPAYNASRPREAARSALNEEAPMGLFDVARGAASALSKSAFPLRGLKGAATTNSVKADMHQDSPLSPTFSDHTTGSGADGEGRVRKRDVVSNMVTGGLVSGIGWVLGAPKE
ncbi:hypothetical protein MMC25_000756 [Agyrium rufum]|nr:hypothetical protein [Agyrium rufum]